MPPLLERDRFAQQLGAWLADAAAGNGRLALLGGEAGVGKTALVHHVIAQSSRQARTAVGACDPLVTPRPLGPLFDIAPSLGPALEDLLESQSNNGDKLFRTLLAELTRTNKPVLLVIEDVHWADEASLDLLRYLGRRIASTRALVVATYRDDELGPKEPLRVVLGDLASAPGVVRVSLPRLTQTAVRTLTEGTNLDPEALYRLTSGNAFFVTEVLAGGAVAHIPPTVRDAVLARASRLSAGARDVLEAAAVIGPRADPLLVPEVAPHADPDAIDECLARGVLYVESGTLAFRHELARQAILETLSPARRIVLHQAVVRAMRARTHGQADLARLSEHAEAAGDGDTVLEFSPAAASRAARLGAHRQAAALYARALRFADRLAPERRAELLEDYAVEITIAESPEPAIAARRAAVEIWRAKGDKLREGDTLSRLAGSLVIAGRNEEGEEAAQAALDILQALPPGRELTFAVRTYANLRMLNRDNAQAIIWGQRAIALAEQFEEPEALSSALNSLGSARLLSGDERGRADLERSRAIALEHGLDAMAVNAWVNLGSVAGELYEFPRADGYFAEGIAYCAERDLDHGRMYIVAWQALSHLYQGRWNAASDAALEVLGRPVAAISRIMALVALGRLRARRGDPEVWPLLDEALELASRTHTLQRLAPTYAARAEAAYLSGDLDLARAQARAVWDLAERHHHAWHLGELGYWRWRAEDLEETPDGAAEPFARQIAGDWATAAELWRERACPYEAARALSESDDEAALREALATFERLGARPMATLTARRLRDLGVRRIPRGPRPRTRAHPAGLTAREAEVLHLLATGLSNAEIGDRMSLSTRTVEHYVSGVLGKLQVRRRTEAAHVATRLGL